jgi:hypothetical protein
MSNTPNLGLVKPAGTDNADIAIINANMDIIDTAMGNKTDNALPISGGTLTGIATAQNNTSYTTKQVRNITLSPSDPSGGSNGDVWIKYV